MESTRSGADRRSFPCHSTSRSNVGTAAGVAPPAQRRGLMAQMSWKRAGMQPGGGHGDGALLEGWRMASSTSAELGALIQEGTPLWSVS